MKAVVQRVRTARVTVLGKVVGEIGSGLLVFLGVGRSDDSSDVNYIAKKVSTLRVFGEASGKASLVKTRQGHMDRSVIEVKGEVLVVSQFTLYGDCHKGRRPSFVNAAPPDLAKSLYLEFIEWLRAEGLSVETGVFQADMDVQLVNDGPVTILLDSKGPS